MGKKIFILYFKKYPGKINSQIGKSVNRGKLGLSFCWGYGMGYRYRDVPFSQALPFLNSSFNPFLSITKNLCRISIVVRLCAIVYLLTAHTRWAVSSHHRVFDFCNLCAGQTPAALRSIFYCNRVSRRSSCFVFCNLCCVQGKPPLRSGRYAIVPACHSPGPF